MDEVAVLEVGFAVNIDTLTSAEGTVDDVFSGMADVAASAGEAISASMTDASESFSSITDAMDELSSMTARSAESVVSDLSSIPSASEHVESSISGIATAAQELPAKVSAAVDEVDEKIETVGTTAQETASKSKSSFEGFDLGSMVTSIGMGVIALQGLSTMAEQTAQTLFGPAMAAENTQASFTNLLGSTKSATDELGKLNIFAAQTQFKTQDIDNLAAKMIAFKTPTQDVIPELTAVGDALTAIGKGTPAEMEGVVDTLGKIGIAGTITQGDITELGEHGIDAFSAIQKGSGLSKDALQAMIDNGTLPAKDAIADLTKGIEANPVYSGGMTKQAQTLSGQMSTLGSNFDQVMASALKPALPGLEKTIGELSKDMSSPAFKQFASTMGKDIAGGLDGAITGITNLVNTGKNLVDFFTQNQAAMDGLEAGLAGIGAVVLAVVIPSMVAWAIAMAPVALEAIVVAAPFVALGLVVGLVIFGIIEAVQHWSQIQAAVGGAVQASMGAVGSFFGGVGHTIQGIFSGIGTAAQNVGAGISSAFKGGINGVIEGLNWLINAVDSFHVSIPPLVVAGVTVFGGVDLGLPYIPDIPLLARGGTVGPGQAFIAGEAGPELIYGGSQGASVMNASQTASLMNNGGGGEIHIHNHIYLDGKEMTNTLMDKVMKIVKGQGGKMVSI